MVCVAEMLALGGVKLTCNFLKSERRASVLILLNFSFEAPVCVWGGMDRCNYTFSKGKNKQNPCYVDKV